MASTLHLPKLGMTMDSGELVRWLVEDGASVEPGQAIFEMETEKVETEVEAEEPGVLKQLVPEGTVLAPGAIVGCLLGGDESEVPAEILERVANQPILPSLDEAGAMPPGAPPLPPPPVEAPLPSAPAAAPPRAPGERVIASPFARRLAAEHGIEIAALAGTGPNGRVVEADVRQAIADAAEAAPAAAETVPYTGRRRLIGQRMRASLQDSAQLTLSVETSVDEALAMLHGLNREWREDRVVALLVALVVKACALALREHPRLNARLDGGEIVVEPDVNIGVAVDLDEGLMVPVVRRADALSLKQLAAAIAELTRRAQDGALSVDEVTGGTFTVTSLESFAVDVFTPVLNPPQAAILGVGRTREVPVFEGARIERGRVTTLSLTFDHQIADGAPAARFLGRVCELLARPYMLM